MSHQKPLTIIDQQLAMAVLKNDPAYVDQNFDTCPRDLIVIGLLNFARKHPHQVDDLQRIVDGVP